MTSNVKLSQTLQTVQRKSQENARLYLLLVLLGTLTLFFAFWTSSPGPAHYRPSLRGTEVTTSAKIEKADPATIYKTVVTGSDAIRSVLQ